ncbi:MAG: stalk domain-containing protein, partial [Peptoniphilus harei]|uniref:stalk domain-containing protein n=2 Tax=Peptoniphilus harei TaxID=54005 RepID=UPI0029000F22
VVEAVKKANPEAKDVTVDDKGNATLTYADGTTNTLTPDKTVSERAKTEVDKKALQDEVDKEKSTKDADKYKNADQDKKDAYDKALADAKKVLENKDATQEEVNKAKDALKAAEEALNGEATVDKTGLQKEADKETSTKESDKYKNADTDKKKAYDDALAKAKEVLANDKATQEEVNKAKKALEEAEKALNGKPSDNTGGNVTPGKPSDNDNAGGNDGYRPGHGGSDEFDRLFRRHDYTPTYPVKTVVPEKTEAATPVRDTLWYVFHINEFQYEVVRNGVVTKRLMDVTPVIQNGRTMLPLRYVAEALQADVKWDAKTRTATFTKDGLTATIQIDSDEIVLSNGKTVKMDSKPLNINDRILVSVTNVANVFGLTNGNTQDKVDQDIEWEQEDKSATIYIRR